LANDRNEFAMKLGFVTAILPDLSLEQVLRFAAEEQYDCVEVMCWPVGKATRRYAGVTHIDVADMTQAKADDIHALCRRHGVSISGLGYYPNILSGDSEESRVATEHLKRVIAAAPLLGLKNVNTFIGADHRLPLQQNLVRFKQVWPDLIRYAEDYDVYVGIENCPMLFSLDEWPSGKNLAYSPRTWRQMFEEIPSNHFGLNYDPSHLVWQMMDYLAPLYEFRERLFHAHAKDMKINRDKLNDEGILAFGWSTPKIPGLGEVNWNAFVSALTDVGYDGAVCVEVEDRAFEKNLESRQQSLRIARNVLRPLI
jgi:sugar phosphate isomerase/epimerase